MRLLMLVIMLLAPAATSFAAALHPVAVAAPAGQVVREGEVRQVISDYIRKRTESLNAEINIKKIGYSGDLKLPAGNVGYEVVAPDSWEGYGSASLALIVRVDDQVKRNQTVLVDVEALTEMVVASRTLERGEVIHPSDLALARRDLAHVQGRFLKSKDDAVGLRTKSAMRANSPVRADYLERVPVVKSGQLVTIVAENDVVRVTAAGRAKGAGAPGDMITVQNTSSGKDLAATVVDATTVKVNF
jgi:flagellar basal body P-ring formation protein FlgA